LSCGAKVVVDNQGGGSDQSQGADPSAQPTCEAFCEKLAQCGNDDSCLNHCPVVTTVPECASLFRDWFSCFLGIEGCDSSACSDEFEAADECVADSASGDDGASPR